jgi:hypothetical protein
MMKVRISEDDTMLSAPAMRRGLSAMGRKEQPELNVPIVMCPKCKQRPMAIKTVRLPLLGKGATDVEMICPKCRVVTTVPTARA